MSSVFLVWIEDADIDPFVIGVTDTREQAEKMIQKSKEVFEDAFEYTIDEMKKNTTIIDDVEYTF